MRSLYALLVGIDTYGDDVGRLRGCRNDVERVFDYLGDPRSAIAHVEPVCLRDDEATRDAIVQSFRSHLGQAGPEDTALFWFSGHGSLVPAHPALAHLEPTGTSQTLVCADSRRDGVQDLLDQELNLLITGVAAGGAHVVVVLDCCHADGGDRAGDRRHAPGLTSPPVLERLLPELQRLAATGSSRDAAATGTRRPDHVSLAACATDQQAYEVSRPEGVRGAFSLALLTELGRLGPSVTYRDLMTGARCQVENLHRKQRPALFPNDRDIVDQPFLGGTARGAAPRIQMSFVRRHWQIDAGACHGISAGTGEDATIVAVHGSDPAREAIVERVLPHLSYVRPVGWEPEAEVQYPIVVTSLPMPATTIAFGGHATDDAPTLNLVRAALRVAAPGPRPSPHLREITPGGGIDRPDLRVRTSAPGIVEILGRDDRPIPGTTADVTTPARAHRLIGDLEHIARWHDVKALANPASEIRGLVRVEIVPRFGDETVAPVRRDALTPDETGAIVLDYTRTADGWAPPHVFVRVRNTSPHALYCVLLDLTDRYAVHPRLFNGDLVAAGGDAWAVRGGPVTFALPKGRPIEPGAAATDWLKLMIAEKPFTSTPFRLRPLDPAKPFAGTLPPLDRSATGSDSVVERLGLRARTSDTRGASMAAHDWATAILPVITRVPRSVRP